MTTKQKNKTEQIARPQITAEQSIASMSDALVAESLVLICAGYKREGDETLQHKEPMPAADWDALHALADKQPITAQMVAKLDQIATGIAKSPQWYKRYLVLQRGIGLMEAQRTA